MLINKLQKAAPTGVSALQRPKISRIKWPRPVDPLHVSMNVYRYPTALDATNRTNETLVAENVVARKYDDNDALSTAAYWWSIASVDIYDNISAKSTAVSITFSGVTTSDIEPGAVDTTALGASAVTGAKIAAGAVDLAKFATGLTPVEFGATLPVTGNFAGRQYFLTTDNKLYRYNGTTWTVSTATTDLLGQILNGQIADNAVSASKIVVTDTSNMVRDPNMSDLTLWTGTGGSLTTIATASTTSSTNRLAIAASTAALEISSARDIPVEASKPYFVVAQVGQTTNAISPVFSLSVDWYSMDAAGVTTFLSTTVVATYTGTGVSKIGNIVTAPATARRMRVYASHPVVATATDLTIYDLFVRRANNGELIVDGSITANKILANTITAGQIAAGAIVASKIAIGAILDDNLMIDPFFEDTTTDLWSGTGGTLTNIADSTSPGGGRILQFDRGASFAGVTMTRTSGLFPVEGSDELYAEMTIKSNASSAAGAYLRLMFFDATKTALAGADGVGYRDYVVNGAMTTGWVTLGNKFTLPATAKYAAVRIIHNTSASNRYMYVASAQVRRSVPGSLIVSGTITADKLNVTTLSAISATLGAVDISSAVIGTLQVGTINLLPDAVTPSKLQNSDTTNMLRDPDLTDKTLWTPSPAGALTSYTQNFLASSAGEGFSKYKLQAYLGPGVSSGSISMTSDFITVEPTRVYYVSAFLGCPTNDGLYAQIDIDTYSQDSSGVLTRVGSNLVGTGMSGGPPIFAAIPVKGNVQIPAGITRIKVNVQMYTLSGNNASITLTSPVVKAVADTYLIDSAAVITSKIDNLAVTTAKIDSLAVTTAKIDNQAVTLAKIQNNILAVRDTASSNVAVSFATGVQKEILRVNAAHTASGSALVALCTTRNTSGGARTMDLEVKDGSGTSFGTALNLVIPDNGIIPFDVVVNGLTGANTNIIFYATLTAAGTLNNSRIQTMSIRT